MFYVWFQVLPKGYAQKQPMGNLGSTKQGTAGLHSDLLLFMLVRRWVFTLDKAISDHRRYRILIGIWYDNTKFPFASLYFLTLLTPIIRSMAILSFFPVYEIIVHNPYPIFSSYAYLQVYSGNLVWFFYTWYECVLIF